MKQPSSDSPGRGRPRKAANTGTTNLAVDTRIADKARARAKELGMPVFDVTNQLMEYGVRFAPLRKEIKVVTYDAPESDSTRDW